MGTTNVKDRQALISPDGSYNGGCVEGADKVATSDATATKIAESDVIAEGEAVIMSALVIGKKSGAVAAAGNRIWGVFRREAAGNVSAVGSSQGTTQEDHAGAPAISLAANTTTQKVEVRVAGIAAETWTWECKWEKLKV
jgi:hypothetical protein